jgi:amino acid permease
MDAATPVSERELARVLRRPQVLAIVVGAMIGTGIYIRPASIAQLLHSPAASIFS